MRTFVTTVGAAAILGFAALGMATPSGASPVQPALPTGTHSAVHDRFTQAGGGDDRTDELIRCLENARINGHVGPPLPVAGRWGCSVTVLH